MDGNGELDPRTYAVQEPAREQEMGITRLTSLTEQSLTRVAATALGLLVLLPAAAISYLFWDELGDRWIPLVLLLILSLLGFLLLWIIVRAFTKILAGLEGVARGESTSIAIQEGAPPQLRQMTEIVNALNKITTDFQENAKQLERFIQQFSTLTELTEITARIPDINELLALVLKKAMASTSAQKGSVLLVREDGRELDTIASQGWTHRPKELDESRFSPAAHVIETGEPLLVDDVVNIPEMESGNDYDRYSSPSCLVMPLKAKAATIGAVCLSEKARNRPFVLYDQQFLTVLLSQVGYAVENARLLQQARGTAVTLRKMVQHKDVELKDAQKQVLQAEKLSALGQLIAGVAHEMNNPLTTVIGYAELVLDAADKNTLKVEEKLKQILREGNRTAKIVQNLLSFARAKKSEKKVVNLNELIAGVVALRKYDLSTRDVELSTDLEEDLPLTMVDADQIQQVLLNLANNAVQAMNRERTKKIRIGSKREDGSILLSVADTGHGMPEEVVSKIFEPFFSTKSTNTNTGLGLSISYGIIKEHGGEILVDSKVGQGTEMTIRLPIVEIPPGATETITQGKMQAPEVGNKTALVVDDEPAIADLMAEQLQMIGFKVEAYTDGAQALERLLEKDFEFVVCDIRMPAVNGRQLYRLVEEARPRNVECFVMTSGDVADPQARLFATNHDIPLIAKPFTKEELWQAAVETLERSSAKC